MAKTDNLTDFLIGVANAIRTKKGTTAKINPQNFEAEIGGITTSKPEQEKTAEATNRQQIILPDSGKTLSKVVVEASPLPNSANLAYENKNGCLIAIGSKTLLLGCENSVIPNDNSVITIGEYAFYRCADLTNVVIPNSVTSIERYAFGGCSGLTSVTIPNSVTSIGGNAFWWCTGLTSITIPDSVTNIGDFAFSLCRGIINVTIGSGVTNIGGYAFDGCRELTTMTVDKMNTVYYSENNCIIEKSTKRLISGCNTSIIPNDVTSIESYAFSERYKLINVNIPNSVASIGSSAFESCLGLISVTIGNGVTNIGSSAFYNCGGLTSITIPDSVTFIGDGVFKSCSGIESLVVATGNKKYHSTNNCIIETDIKALIVGCKTSIIPSDDSVTSIADNAFYGCDGLTSITIPDSVTNIGRVAFGFCDNLADITMLSTIPPQLGNNSFPLNVTTITVPAGCGEAYKTADSWKNYADKIVEAEV